MDEIRDVTFDFAGQQLYPFQAAQYLYNAVAQKDGKDVYPFRDAKRLTEACAIMGGESLWYLQAWHANVLRDTDGMIVYDAQGRITVKSIDLGWIQRSIDLQDAAYAPDEIEPLVQSLLTSSEYSYLARPAQAANEAAKLYVARGWQPWYAYSNKTWRRHLPKAGLAVANFLAVEFMNKQSYYVIRGT